MSFSSELERAFFSWQEEDAKVVQDARLVEDIYAGGSLTYAKAIQKNFTPSLALESIKESVLAELSKPRGIDYAFGVGLGALTDISKEIDATREQINEDASVLGELFTRTPETTSVDRAQLAQELGANLARLDRLASTLEPPTPTTLADAIVSALSVGDPSMVEAYLAQRGLSPEVSSEVYPSQIVDELSSRIYGVSTPSPPTLAGSGVAAPSISGGIEAVAGAQSTTVNDLGEVTITLEQGRVLTGQIQKQRQQTRLKGANNVQAQSLKSQDIADELVESSRFEIWACAVLDIVAQIQAGIALISTLVDQAQAILLKLKAIVNNANLGKLNLSAQWPQNVLDVSALIGELVENLIPSDKLSTITTELGSVGLGSSGFDSICDHNHQRYCSIHGRLLSLQDMIGKYTQRLSLDLGGLSIEQVEIDFGWSPNTVTAAIDSVMGELTRTRDELNALSAKLKREACAWVSRKIKGRSKTLLAISDAMVVLASTLVALKLVSDVSAISGLEVSAKLSSSIAQLKRLGLTQAAERLERLELSSFLSMDTDRSTGAGETAAVLRQAAWATNDQTSQTQLWQLHQIAQTRHEQQVSHLEVRQAMASRYYTSTRGTQRAYVKTQSTPLVKKVDDELTLDRDR